MMSARCGPINKGVEEESAKGAESFREAESFSSSDGAR